MKIVKWLTIIITFGLIVWFLFGLEVWAREWKDLFLYMDNWLLFIALFAFLMLAKRIGSWVITTQMRVLK